MANPGLYGLLAVLLTVYLLDAYFCRRRHPQEPPCVRPKIPLFGHLIGLAVYGSLYYSAVSPGQPELFALPIFSFRIYVLNSRHMFSVIQRNARTLSFRPFIKKVSAACCDASDAFLDMHEQDHPWSEDLFRDTRTALAPGKGLDYQNLITGETLQRFIEELDEDMGNGRKQNFKVYEWIQHLMSVAATDGVYGKNNPFRDPEIERSYWLWTRGIGKLIASAPRIFIQTELKARDTVFNAFETYWLSDWSDAADITLARKRLYDREGVSLKDQAGNQASFNLALLGNTVPTAFWALYDIISRPQLVQDIRAEIEANAVVKNEGKPDATIELDVAALRTHCPLLLSSYQESQRTRSIHANIREVISDTVIESPTTETKYFLCKGQYLQMPSGPIHKDPNIWGPTASVYDPYRFMKDNAPLPKSELPNSYAFLAWGSAPHLCPARQFASTEIMLFVALMILRFEFSQAGGGAWKTLKSKTGELTTVMAPKDEVFVDIERRGGWQGKWVLKMGDSNKKVTLASG